MLKYLGNLFLTFVSVGLVYGIYYVIDGFKAPTLESLAFGVAFLALFETVKFNKYFD